LRLINQAVRLRNQNGESQWKTTERERKNETKTKNKEEGIGNTTGLRGNISREKYETNGKNRNEEGTN
jgi:hypothetical protein